MTDAWGRDPAGTYHDTPIKPQGEEPPEEGGRGQEGGPAGN